MQCIGENDSNRHRVELASSDDDKVNNGSSLEFALYTTDSDDLDLTLKVVGGVASSGDRLEDSVQCTELDPLIYHKLTQGNESVIGTEIAHIDIISDRNDQEKSNVSVDSVGVINNKRRVYTQECVDEHIDSGCSDSMGGDLSRLSNIRKLATNRNVSGFNNSRTICELVGNNKDNHDHLYVGTMPQNRDLLSAHRYTNDGAVVLLNNVGYIIKIPLENREEFDKYIKSYDISHVLKVKQNVYLVDYRILDSIESDCKSLYGALLMNNDEVDYSESDTLDIKNSLTYMADVYKNGRVNYSSVDELIMGYYISGFTPRTLRSAVVHKSVLGMNPLLTVKALTNFEKTHGRSPDILQMAVYDHQGHMSAYEGHKIVLERPGQVISSDHMMSDYNERVIATDETGKELTKRVMKMASYGGAVFANVTIDHYTGFVIGKLGKPGDKSSEIVSEILDIFEVAKHPVELFIADVGLLVEAQTRVMTPEVLKLLLKRKVKSQKVMPGERNHNIGGNLIENIIRWIRRKMRLGMIYVLSNPNVEELDYSEDELLKFWGEIFLWAVLMMNFGPSYNNKKITRWEAFMGHAPNMQTIRLLPIFSIVLVRTKEVYEYGLYLGPHYLGPHVAVTPGAIRVAIKATSGIVTVLLSVDYKCVTEGYNVNLNPQIDRGIIQMMRDNEKIIDSRDICEEDNIDDTDIIPNLISIDEADEHDIAQAADDEANPRDRQVEEHDARSTEESSSKLSRRKGQQKAVKFRSLRLRLQDPEIEDQWWVPPRRRDASGVNQQLDSGVNQQLDPDKDDEAEELAQAVQVSTPESRGVSFCIDEKEAKDKAKAEKKRLRRIASRTRKAKWKLANVLLDDRARQLELYMSNVSGWANLTQSCEYEEVCESYSFNAITEDVRQYYYNYDNDAVYTVTDVVPDFRYGLMAKVMSEEAALGFKVVTGPGSFNQAMRDPKWGAPCALEKSTITDGPMVLISKETADEAIMKGADVLNIFPIYEEKEKEGKLVYKVRLVIDGSKHKNHGDTYAETPNREELRIFMHFVAHYDWELLHVDEKRAFLSSAHRGPEVLAKLGKDYYKVLGAMYGLKSAPRDYQLTVISRLVNDMGFVRLGMCSCIYYRKDLKTGGIVYIFCFVDDFLWTGSTLELIMAGIEEYRTHANVTDPVLNPEKVLGLELSRDRILKTISLSLESKTRDMRDYIIVRDLCGRLRINIETSRYVPVSPDDIIIGDSAFEGESPREWGTLCTPEEVSEYLTLVGGHLWQLGVRWEVLFCVLYLTWQTHKPRLHHLRVAVKLVLYLYQSMTFNKLVLGGKDPIEILTYSDMSLNTAPNGKSVIGYGTRLGKHAGLVCGKCKATVDVVLSSFEGELEGVEWAARNNSLVNEKLNIAAMTEAFKQSAMVTNVMMELGEFVNTRRVFSDNEAMINFVNGKAQGRGMKHATLRLWYMRGQIDRGYELIWMSGKLILADAMTKCVPVTEHEEHVKEVMGQRMLRDVEEKLEEEA